MGTYTPPTTLLVQHVATQLATITTPGWRTNIGANVATERVQALDDDAPFCTVLLAGWEATSPFQVERVCELRIEVAVPATDANAEAQARLAVEDVFERFRLPGAEVSLGGGAFALLRPVESAEIVRPEGAKAVIATLTLRAELRET